MEVQPHLSSIDDPPTFALAVRMSVVSILAPAIGSHHQPSGHPYKPHFL
jgi:hypothetical protein